MVKVEIPKDILAELKYLTDVLAPIQPELESFRHRLKTSLSRHQSDMTSKEWKAVMSHVTVEIFKALAFFEDGVDKQETTKPK